MPYGSSLYGVAQYGGSGVGGESGSGGGWNVTATIQIVDADRTTIRADFSDPSGVNNPYGIITKFARGNRFNLGKPATRYTEVSSPSVHGGRIVKRTDPLTRTTWVNRFQVPPGGTLGDLLAGVNEIGALLAEGGRLLKWSPDGSTALTGYALLEPSDQLAALVGNDLELFHLIQDGMLLDVGVEVVRQPYLEFEEIDPAVQLLANGGLNGLPILRGYAWDSVTGITSQEFNQADDAYVVTVATATARNLQQTTAVGSVASGQVAPFAFDARVEAVAGTPKMQAVVEYMESNGTAQVGADQTGGLVTLTTRWQRIQVIPAAAGANTSRVRVSLKVDNDDATAVRIQLRNAQAEVGAVPTLYRSAAEPVASDPSATGTAARFIRVWCHGTAPTFGRVTALADAAGVGRVVLHRETVAPGYVASVALHKELEEGTLGADSASVADSDAVGGDALQVTYTSPDPVVVSDNSVGGVGDEVVIPAPAGIQAGHLLEAWVFRTKSTSKISAGRGWKLIPDPTDNRTNIANNFGETIVLYGFYKIADADDVEAVDFTFNVIDASGGGSNSYRAWMNVWANIDQVRPLDTSQFRSPNTTTTPSTADIAPTSDDAGITAVFAGVASVGTLTWGNVGQSDPVFTERDDGTADVTFRGMSAHTGVLATAAGMGTKESVSSLTVDAVTAIVAWRKAAAPIVTRSQVVYGSLQPGDYELWARFRATAASRQRLRFEWATRVNPTVLHALPDYIFDTSGATTFGYVARSFGHVTIPEEFDLNAFTVRFSSGLEDIPVSPANFRGDTVWLAPANEQAGVMTSPSLVADGEYLVGDAEANRVYHLADDDTLLELGTAEGPVPVELLPGSNLFHVTVFQDRAAGHLDRQADITAVPTIGISYTRRERG